MSEQAIEELRRNQNESLEKYAYFLLAASGAAIGFALSKTDGKPLGWNLLPVGLAIVSWGLSFYFGCKHILSRQRANTINIQMGNQALQARSIEQRIRINEFGEKEFNKEIKKFIRNGNRQFGWLIAGVIFFVLWYVLELYLTTYPNNSFSILFHVK